MGSGDARAVASLAGHAAGQRRRAGLLEQAIAIDPNYGQALALFATNHMFGVHLGWTDIATAAPAAEQAALAAIAADSEDAWAHTALGSVYFSTRRLDHSLAEFELALQLNPNFSLAQGYYALALSYCGRWQDAYAATQRAIRQSPRDPSSAIYYGVAAYAQFVGRNYQEAIALAREATRQRGDLSGAYRVLTVAAGMAGQIEVARTALAGVAPDPAQYFPGLDRDPATLEARRRSRALSGRLSPRRAGIDAVGSERHVAATPVTAACQRGVVLTGIGCSVAYP